LLPHKLELKTRFVASVIEFPTAGQAGDGAANTVDAREVSVALRAAIKEAASLLRHRKGQGVAAELAANAQVVTGAPPFRAMGTDAASTGASMSEEVSQLMAQGAVNLRGAVFAQTRIHSHQRLTKISAAGCGAQARVPFDP
jgi:hypothetical protein